MTKGRGKNEAAEEEELIVCINCSCVEHIECFKNTKPIESLPYCNLCKHAFCMNCSIHELYAFKLSLICTECILDIKDLN